jgi:ABC-type transporter Mla subunit MlaD
MTQSNDRLDRIEATLERVSQQLDNQVVVNAELRQSTQELRQTTSSLAQTTSSLAQTTVALTDAVNVLMTSVTSLTGVVSQHQQNFVVITEQMQEMQSEIRGLQTENRRILDILQAPPS